MQNLNLNVTETILSYLDFRDALCLRLLNKEFRDLIIPQLIHDLSIIDPREELVNALRDNTIQVVTYYKKFCHIWNFRLSNLTINQQFILVLVV